MGKADIDFLARKYDVDTQLREALKKKEYRDVMERVFDINIKDLSEKVGARSKQNWEKMLDKPSIPKQKVRLPSVADIIPSKKAIFDRAFQRSTSVAKKVRGPLAGKLRDTIAKFEKKTGTKAFLRNKINPKLEAEMSKQITGFFKAYTRKKPRAKVPPNIQTLAVTELRVSIDNSKRVVAEKVKALNPELQITKTWIHNAKLSKEPDNIRIGHQIISGTTIPLEEMFDVPIYKRIGGIPVKVGETKMRHPHDVDAPAVQVVSCHCDTRYNV